MRRLPRTNAPPLRTGKPPAPTTTPPRKYTGEEFVRRLQEVNATGRRWLEPKP